MRIKSLFHLFHLSLYSQCCTLTENPSCLLMEGLSCNELFDDQCYLQIYLKDSPDFIWNTSWSIFYYEQPRMAGWHWTQKEKEKVWFCFWVSSSDESAWLTGIVIYLCQYSRISLDITLPMIYLTPWMNPQIFINELPEGSTLRPLNIFCVSLIQHQFPFICINT